MSGRPATCVFTESACKMECFSAQDTFRCAAQLPRTEAEHGLLAQHPLPTVSPRSLSHHRRSIGPQCRNRAENSRDSQLHDFWVGAGTQVAFAMRRVRASPEEGDCSSD